MFCVWCSKVLATVLRFAGFGDPVAWLSERSVADGKLKLKKLAYTE